MSGPKDFARSAHVALDDPSLQKALRNIATGFVGARRAAMEGLPEFEALRSAARDIRAHTLANLEHYLTRFEARVQAEGGQVHWAPTAEDARTIILNLCRAAGARRLIKGKSMVSEEIALNPALEAGGFEVTESDLGEYIIQLAGEPPSHIIAPAIHKTLQDIASLFSRHHEGREVPSGADSPRTIVDEARHRLREKFLGADLGITGANFLVAETGSVVLVTNEGNGDLTATLPRVHIVLAGIEKVVPTLNDASVFLRLLARSATGQQFTAYTSLHSGPRREGDQDGPEEFHVVLLDGGRSALLGGEFEEMLYCIRCGACLNHCPVYGAIGGHAYGWVYPGPMGSVLTPLALGLEEAGALPQASTLCGRCAAVCPLSIPLPDMLRQLRRQAFRQAGLTPSRAALRVWRYLVRRPRLYRRVTALAAGLLGRWGGRKGAIRQLPGGGAWLRARDLPAPQGESFQQAWRRKGGAT